MNLIFDPELTVYLNSLIPHDLTVRNGNEIVRIEFLEARKPNQRIQFLSLKCLSRSRVSIQFLLYLPREPNILPQ